MNRLRKFQIDFESKLFYAWQKEDLKIKSMLVDYHHDPAAIAYILEKFGKQACSCCAGKGYREK